MLFQRRHFGNDGAFAVVTVIVTIVRDNLLSANQEGQARSGSQCLLRGKRGSAGSEAGAGWWQPGRAPESSGGVGGAGGRGAGRGGADSRTPAGGLLGQLQPVDGQAVGSPAHAAPLALAVHVTLRLAHVCRLDLVAAVALGAELQPSVQVAPGGGCCQAGVPATTETPEEGRASRPVRRPQAMGRLWGLGGPGGRRGYRC